MKTLDIQATVSPAPQNKPGVLLRAVEKTRGLVAAGAAAASVAVASAHAEMTLPTAGGIITAAEVAFTAVATFIVARLAFKAGAKIYSKIFGG